MAPLQIAFAPPQARMSLWTMALHYASVELFHTRILAHSKNVDWNMFGAATRHHQHGCCEKDNNLKI